MAGVLSPEKELRFTRSGQAPVFWVAAAVFVSTGVTMLATSWYRGVNPELPHPLWALVPLGLAALCVRMAVHLTKHAYLILTPLGIEIFPFFRPARGMQLVTWQEVVLAEVDDARTVLTLHFNAGKTSGIRLSMKPVRKEFRELLAKALLGRIDNGHSAS